MRTGSQVVCTMPGRFGDILWALPTVRAIARYHDQKVELAVSAKYERIVPLVTAGAREYISRAYGVDSWVVEETAPMTPSRPPALWRALKLAKVVHHLGYEEWPKTQLPYDIMARAGVGLSDVFSLIPRREAATGAALSGEHIRGLLSPWIQVAPSDFPPDISIGFTDEWAELKVGLILALADAFPTHTMEVVVPAGSRLIEEWPILRSIYRVSVTKTDLLTAARIIRGSKVFVGCLSSLGVLAQSMGVPGVFVEPSTERHHPIFWTNCGERSTLVLGNDDKPTFDARHMVIAVAEKLGLGQGGH